MSGDGMMALDYAARCIVCMAIILTLVVCVLAYPWTIAILVIALVAASIGWLIYRAFTKAR